MVSNSNRGGGDTVVVKAVPDEFEGWEDDDGERLVSILI